MKKIIKIQENENALNPKWILMSCHEIDMINDLENWHYDFIENNKVYAICDTVGYKMKYDTYEEAQDQINALNLKFGKSKFMEIKIIKISQMKEINANQHFVKNGIKLNQFGNRVNQDQKITILEKPKNLNALYSKTVVTPNLEKLYKKSLPIIPMKQKIENIAKGEID